MNQLYLQDDHRGNDAVQFMTRRRHCENVQSAKRSWENENILISRNDRE